MKIKVLGCSNSWTEKHTSCFLVNDNILIDCGIDAYKAYIKLGKPLTDIKLFLISHFHADHIMGLYIFLTEYVEAKNKIDKKPIIVGLKGIKKFCTKIFKMCNLYNADLTKHFEFIEIDKNSTIQFEDLKIEIFKFTHGEVYDLGYVLTKDNFGFGYTGDIDAKNNLTPFVNKCDMCFVDASGLQSSLRHFGANDLVKLINQYPTKQFYATHYSKQVLECEHLKDNLLKENDEFEVGIN